MKSVRVHVTPDLVAHVEAGRRQLCEPVKENSWVNKIRKAVEPLATAWGFTLDSLVLGESGAAAVEAADHRAVKLTYSKSEALVLRYLSTLGQRIPGLPVVYNVVSAPNAVIGEPTYLVLMERMLETFGDMPYPDTGRLPSSGECFDFLEAALEKVGLDHRCMYDWHEFNHMFSYDGYPTWIDWGETPVYEYKVIDCTTPLPRYDEGRIVFPDKMEIKL